MKSVFAAIAVVLFALPVMAEPKVEFLAASTVDLDNPHDLRLSPDKRHLYISDVGNDRVVIVDPVSLALIDRFGADHQGGTHDIDFDSDGLAYVADTHNNRVTVYRMSGTKAALIGELSDRIRGPEGVLVHPNGRIYVAGAWSGNVVVYDAGKVVGELDGLSSPHDLALDPDGNVWLADAGNDRLLLLSPALEVLKEWKDAPYHFKGVRYLDVLADGTVIAADKNSHRILFIAADGALLHVMGDGRPGKGVNKFRTPEGVEVDGDILWLSDSGNDRIVRYRFSLD